MNKILAIVLLLSAISTSAFCQNDSNSSIMKFAAETDVKNFKLDKEIWHQFRKHHFAPASDYFKPRKANVADTSFLTDSVYVKAFREYAYKKTLHRRTAGHTVWVVGSITAGVVSIILTVAVLSVLSQSGP